MLKQHHQWTHRLAQTAALVSAVAGFAWANQTVAHASTPAIPDISEWQGRLSASQVANLKNQVSFVINRRQYGSGYQDKYATNNTSLYVKYGIPFGEYDYARFTSAASAKREAQDFYDRSNKDAQFYVLDFEENDVTSGSTNAAVKAWYNEMRSLTGKHLVFYSYQSFATSYANSARQSFDAQWIANYSYTPTISFALWQYTDSHYLSALNEYTDNSKAMTNVHPVSWWTDSVSLALTHTGSASDSSAASTSSSSASASSSSSAPTTTTSQSAAISTAYSQFKVGQHVYLHKGASTYTDGTRIPRSVRQRFYRISRVKTVNHGSSHQALYLGALGKWIYAQDGTGYWIGNHAGYRLNHRLNVYSNASLTHKTRSYYVAGDTVRGKIVKAPNGHAYRIKTYYGYVTANTKYATVVK